MTMSYQAADDVLNLKLRSGATPYILLHTGNPGADGTANIAQVDDGSGGTENIARKAIVFGDAPANHAENDERFVKNTAVVEWSGAEIDPSQEITHITIWDNNDDDFTQVEFIFAATTPKITGSDGVKIGIGDVEVALSVFAKPA